MPPSIARIALAGALLLSGCTKDKPAEGADRPAPRPPPARPGPAPGPGAGEPAALVIPPGHQRVVLGWTAKAAPERSAVSGLRAATLPLPDPVHTVVLVAVLSCTDGHCAPCGTATPCNVPFDPPPLKPERLGFLPPLPGALTGPTLVTPELSPKEDFVTLPADTHAFAVALEGELPKVEVVGLRRVVKVGKGQRTLFYAPAPRPGEPRASGRGQIPPGNPATIQVVENPAK